VAERLGRGALLRVWLRVRVRLSVLSALLPGLPSVLLRPAAAAASASAALLLLPPVLGTVLLGGTALAQQQMSVNTARATAFAMAPMIVPPAPKRDPGGRGHSATRELSGFRT